MNIIFYINYILSCAQKGKKMKFSSLKMPPYTYIYFLRLWLRKKGQYSNIFKVPPISPLQNTLEYLGFTICVIYMMYYMLLLLIRCSHLQWYNCVYYIYTSWILFKWELRNNSFYSKELQFWLLRISYFKIFMKLLEINVGIFIILRIGKIFNSLITRHLIKTDQLKNSVLIKGCKLLSDETHSLLV